jgi:hypothetical protein
MCCLFHGDDVVNTDIEQFDCQTCQVAESIESLDERNVRAWRLYQHLAQRIVVDAQLATAVFRRVADELDEDEYAGLIERLGTIYDVISPKKTDGA